MVLPELAARLNCTEYKNWVKAGYCLLLLRGCLQGFVGREMVAFHRGLLASAPGLSPGTTCRSGSRCSPRARQVSICPGALTTASLSRPRPRPPSQRSVPCTPWCGPTANPGAQMPNDPPSGARPHRRLL